MNDALNQLYLELYKDLSAFSDSIQCNLKDRVKAIVDLERKAVKNEQLIEIKALHLIRGDRIFDLQKKTVQVIDYVEYRKDCQFNVPKGNREILVSYGDDEPCDYLNEFSEVYILVDIADVDSVFNRPEPEWEEI